MVSLARQLRLNNHIMEKNLGPHQLDRDFLLLWPVICHF